MGHVRDRWMVPGPNGRKIRGARYGRGQRWQARWLENGHEKSLTFDNQDAAKDHVAAMRTKTDHKIRTALTVEEYGHAWLRMQLHYAPQSRESAESRLRSLINPSLGDLLLGEVDREDVQNAVVEWSERVAPATVKQTYSFVKSMFRTAAEDGLIAQSPCVKQVRLPRPKREKVTPLTSAQVLAIAEAMPERYKGMVLVGAATGLRGGELRGLTEDRIIGDTLLVDRQCVGRADKRPVFGPPKSGSSARRVTLGTVGVAALKEHREAFPAGLDGLVFPVHSGGAIDRQWASTVWRDATAGMGLRERSGWHDLRHFHASALIADGHSPRVVCDRLGHSDPSVTMAVYAHLWHTDEAKLNATIDAIFGP